MRLSSWAAGALVWVVFQFFATGVDVWSELADEHRSARNMASQCASSLQQMQLTPVECRRARDRAARWLAVDVFVRTVREAKWCFGWRCDVFVGEMSWTTQAVAVASCAFAWMRPRVVASARGALERRLAKRRVILDEDD